MKISIAMATYNGADFLLDQLNSISEQTCLPDELIVSDDCSSDNTLELLEHFARVAPFPVKIISASENVGFTRNYGRAFQECTGDVIFICDQDNSWFPERISRVLDAFQTDDSILVATNDCWVTQQDLKPYPGSFFERAKSRQVDLDVVGVGCCMAFRPSLIPIIMPMIQKNTQSYDILINSVGRILNKKTIIEEPLLLFRQHNSNVSVNSTHLVSLRILMRFVRMLIGGGRAKYFELMILSYADIVTEIKRHPIFGSDQGLIDSAQSIAKRLTHPYEQRLEILSCNIFTRWIKCLKFYFAGGYDSFGGWRSMLRDILFR